jgi:hypothetical protein
MKFTKISIQIKDSKQIKSSQKHKDYNWRKEMGG